MFLTPTPLAYVVIALFIIPSIYIATIKKTELKYKYGWLILISLTSYLGLILFLVVNPLSTMSKRIAEN